MDTIEDQITILELLEMSIQDISGDERYTSVCLYTDQLVLTSDSSDLPFAAATSRLGCEVAVKARTKAVEDTLRCFNVENGVDISGSQIPIVPCIDALDNACLYDGALVVSTDHDINSQNAHDGGQRDEQVLVVWCDKTTAIVEQYRRTEHRLRHLVGDCMCDGGRDTSNQNASVENRRYTQYAGYEGIFDEDVQERLLAQNPDPLGVIPKELPAVDPALTLADPSVGSWVGSQPGRTKGRKLKAPTKAAMSGGVGKSQGIQDRTACVSRVAIPGPRTMGKNKTHMRYDNTPIDMGADDDTDSGSDSNDEYADGLTRRRTKRAHAVPDAEAYATRSRGRASQSASERHQQHLPLRSTAGQRGGGCRQSSHQTSQGTLETQEPSSRITAAEEEKWRAMDDSIKEGDAGPSTATRGVKRPSQLSRRSKRKSSSADCNDINVCNVKDKKQKTASSAPAQKKEFFCPRKECGHQSFDRHHEFHRHLLGCLDIKQFVCDCRGKTWARKDARDRHVKETGCNGSQDSTGDGSEASTQIGEVNDAAIHRRAAELGVSMKGLVYVLGFLTDIETAILLRGSG
ncbi:hypothetical protein IEO21_05770 [Rhodonia placenta]|uniref:DUF7928 domain-containing protein n=1 Tax=Rhodonia placenta TaxID=104341 RepID=A0A8H7P1A0_9APHY|nr:hypothetical protein IEO21_05770 [Postia placenta]